MKKNLEYLIAINGDEEDIQEKNKSWGTDFKSTDWHYEKAMNMIEDAIIEVGDKGGWYIGDGIRIKVEIEYSPEDKQFQKDKYKNGIHRINRPVYHEIGYCSVINDWIIGPIITLILNLLYETWYTKYYYPDQPLSYNITLTVLSFLISWAAGLLESEKFII